MPSGTSKALQELAASILASTDGNIGPSRKIVGLGALTDELLVVASDALQVAVDAAPGAKPSGKALQRCLARLVAAAMGSEVHLDPGPATTAGKRLEKQAAKVRAAAIEASIVAATQRREAQAAAATNGSLADGLSARLEQIDAAEAAALAAPCREVYVGFHEIAAPTVARPAPTVDPDSCECTLQDWEAEMARRKVDPHSWMHEASFVRWGWGPSWKGGGSFMEYAQSNPYWSNGFEPEKIEWEPGPIQASSFKHSPVQACFLYDMARDLWIQLYHEKRDRAFLDGIREAEAETRHAMEEQRHAMEEQAVAMQRALEAQESQLEVFAHTRARLEESMGREKHELEDYKLLLAQACATLRGEEEKPKQPRAPPKRHR